MDNNTPQNTEGDEANASPHESIIYSDKRLIKIAICWYHACLGGAYGYFAALIPIIKQIYNLSNFMLGIVLLVSVCAAIIGALVVAKLIKRIGSHSCLLIGTFMTIVVFPFLGYHGPFWCLILCVCGLGISFAWNDISASDQGVMFEMITSKPALGLFTSTFSVGGLVGVLLAGLIASFSDSSFLTFACFSFITILPSIALSRFLLDKSIKSSHDCSKAETAIDMNEMNSTIDRTIIPSNEMQYDDFIRSRNASLVVPIIESNSQFEQPGDEFKTGEACDNDEIQDVSTASITSSRCYLFCLILLGLIGYMINGAASDWSAVYLRYNFDAIPIISSLGYASFVAMLVVGRFFCDYLSTKCPHYRIFQVCGIVTSLGLVVVSLASFADRGLGVVITIIGFAISGAGVSVMTPLVTSVAGMSVTSMNSSDAIAFVQSVMYIGILLGPPIVGFLSDHLGGLQYAFLFVAGIALVIPIIATYYGRTFDFKRSSADRAAK